MFVIQNYRCVFASCTERHSCVLRCIGTPLCFFQQFFAKGNNFCDFLFAFLADVVLLNWGLLLQEKIFSKKSKFSPLKVNRGFTLKGKNAPVGENSLL